MLFQTNIYGPERIGGGNITVVSDADVEGHVRAASVSARSWMPSWSKSAVAANQSPARLTRAQVSLRIWCLQH